jgi:hypothetical protein
VKWSSLQQKSFFSSKERSAGSFQIHFSQYPVDSLRRGFLEEEETERGQRKRKWRLEFKARLAKKSFGLEAAASLTVVLTKLVIFHILAISDISKKVSSYTYVCNVKWNLKNWVGDHLNINAVFKSLKMKALINFEGSFNLPCRTGWSDEFLKESPKMYLAQSIVW